MTLLSNLQPIKMENDPFKVLMRQLEEAVKNNQPVLITLVAKKRNKTISLNFPPRYFTTGHTPNKSNDL